MNKLYMIIPIFALAGGLAYGNVGFTPVYQPSHSTYPYAQLSDTTTQSCPTATPADVTIDTNDSIYKLTHPTSSHLITIQESGVYQIIAVPQVGEETAQANGEWKFWLLINGTNVANTSIEEHVTPQVTIGESSTATLNWIGHLNANSTVSFQQLCTSANIALLTTAAATPPVTPSIIITIARMS